MKTIVTWTISINLDLSLVFESVNILNQYTSVAREAIWRDGAELLSVHCVGQILRHVAMIRLLKLFFIRELDPIRRQNLLTHSLLHDTVDDKGFSSL